MDMKKADSWQLNCPEVDPEFLNELDNVFCFNFDDDPSKPPNPLARDEIANNDELAHVDSTCSEVRPTELDSPSTVPTTTGPPPDQFIDGSHHDRSTHGQEVARPTQTEAIRKMPPENSSQAKRPSKSRRIQTIPAKDTGRKNDGSPNSPVMSPHSILVLENFDVEAKKSLLKGPNAERHPPQQQELQHQALQDQSLFMPTQHPHRAEPNDRRPPPPAPPPQAQEAGQPQQAPQAALRGAENPRGFERWRLTPEEPLKLLGTTVNGEVFRYDSNNKFHKSYLFNKCKTGAKREIRHRKQCLFLGGPSDRDIDSMEKDESLNWLSDPNHVCCCCATIPHIEEKVHAFRELANLAAQP